MAWALSGERTGQVIRIDICERISCRKWQLRVEAHIQPHPERKSVVPRNGGERSRPRGAPQGGGGLARSTVGAQSSTMCAQGVQGRALPRDVDVDLDVCVNMRMSNFWGPNAALSHFLQG